MIEFGFVPLHEVAREIAPNIGRHYAEMTDGDDYGLPDIDWDSYLAASYAGCVRVVTARDNGILVGYSVFTLGNNLRYKNLIEANSDGIFLEKEYRGALFKEFKKKIDEYLPSIGVREVNYCLSDDRVGRALGCKTTHKVWSKRYGK